MSDPFIQKRGFALVSVLIILVVVAIFVVAYTTVTRSERTASHNFSERERAEAMADGMLNRILADTATPEYQSGQRLKPYTSAEYYDGTSKLPLAVSPYLVDPAATGNDGYRSIYAIQPQATISEENSLVRISRPVGSAGTAAYSPKDWAYLGLKNVGDVVLPKDASGQPITPEWIDYYETLPDGSKAAYPSGQVAFAIWADGGKFDVNMAGEDSAVNGLAPHNLGIEEMVAGSADLVQRLDGNNRAHDRNNFSLRQIKASSDALNRTGDDQWVFSLRELVTQGMATADQAMELTTFSRDFDVRPEWDGDRSAANAQKFLRSFINNPKLFELFQNTEAGPFLVKATLDETQLKAALPATLRNGPDVENWMQVMRLLATIRLSLPPFTNLAATNPVEMDRWSDHDVWGIALNILQASSTPSDHNLFAYDNKQFPNMPYRDPHLRYGIRASPYVTEVAVKMECLKSPDMARPNYKITEYIEIWNPYNMPLNKPSGQPILYRAGEFAGLRWPAYLNGGSAIWSLYDVDCAEPKTNSNTGWAAPSPGQFKVIQLRERTISYAQLTDPAVSETVSKFPALAGSFMLRIRPFLQNIDYYSGWRTSTDEADMQTGNYSITTGPFYRAGVDDHMLAYIPKTRVPTVEGGVIWYSFQIDDPRMSAFSRNFPYSINNINGTTYLGRNDSSQTPGQGGFNQKYSYSWWGYLGSHSIATLASDPYYSGKSFTVGGVSVAGYNANFGVNYPGGINSQGSFNKAMSTFALPCRPLQNLGELGAVFANRPWRTLSFAGTITPLDNAVVASTRWNEKPTAFLDYFTTIGTESTERVLNFKEPGQTNYSETMIAANVNKRKQGFRWLFDDIQEQSNNTQVPAGDLRPIRGRVNLNMASEKVLTTLLKAPYRLPNSLGLLATTSLNPRTVSTSTAGSDLEITIPDADAQALAQEIIKVRPFRSLTDLAKLDVGANSIIKTLLNKYPDPVVDGIMGRLAQFGTVRQQIYTVDMIARTLNPEAERRLAAGQGTKRVVTAEVGLRFRVYFDTFTRKAFVESVEPR